MKSDTLTQIPEEKNPNSNLLEDTTNAIDVYFTDSLAM